MSHPEVPSDRLRVRFLRFGDYSLDIEIFAYVRTNDFDEYWAVREDLYLRIMDIVNEAGTSFAFPSSTAYFTEDAGLDTERSGDAGAAMACQGQTAFSRIRRSAVCGAGGQARLSPRRIFASHAR